MCRENEGLKAGMSFSSARLYFLWVLEAHLPKHIDSLESAKSIIRKSHADIIVYSLAERQAPALLSRIAPKMLRASGIEEDNSECENSNELASFDVDMRRVNPTVSSQYTPTSTDPNLIFRVDPNKKCHESSIVGKITTPELTLFEVFTEKMEVGFLKKIR